MYGDFVIAMFVFWMLGQGLPILEAVSKCIAGGNFEVL
jgi:hypothetical protein